MAGLSGPTGQDARSNAVAKLETVKKRKCRAGRKMLQIEGSTGLHKIVVLNPKGGSGKTTIAFNLAGYLASTGRSVALVDLDNQGSSTRWLSNRPAGLPHIYCASVRQERGRGGETTIVELPTDVEFAVIDSPAAVPREELIDYTCGAHAILVPVLPSDLDIHAATSLVSKLLLVAQVSRRNKRLGIVANRVNERTLAYRQLRRFLSSLSIAVVALLRDSQNYTHAARQGRCIHEMPASRVSKDLAQWESVTQWLERCLAKPLTARDLLRPETDARSSKHTPLWRPALLPAAAVFLAALLSYGFWAGGEATDVSAPKPEAAADAQPDEAQVFAGVGSQPIEDSTLVDAADELRQRWQLSGVAQAGDQDVVFLKARDTQLTRRVTADQEVEGWAVAAAGRDFAVLAQNGHEVRLELDTLVSRQTTGHDSADADASPSAESP